MNLLEQLIWLIIAVGAVVLIIVGIYESEQREVENYNKKHKTNFKTIADLQNEKLKIKKAETAKKEKQLEKEHKEQEEKRIETSEPSGSDIGARLKKLRQMYKDGILSKVEFEKAKNKLLK